MTEPNDSWLPNLVGGVSIWKLAPDLNEARFFDGRLLVPETEGSDSLPARVEWDLTGLVPLAVYFFSGRLFVRGIAAGAVKG